MIETDRLRLVKFTVDDAAFMLELLNTPSWIQYIGNRNVRTIQEAEQYIINGALKSYSQHGFGPYVIKLNTNGLSIGLCGLFKRDLLNDPDIGFAILPDFAGNRYGFEAASAVMTYARTVLGLTRIVGITLPSNQNSIRLLEKLGLRFEESIRFSPEGEETLLFGTPVVGA